MIREYFERLIADIVINIGENEQVLDNILNTFFVPLLEKENCDELADQYLHNTVNALMQTINIKALAEISKDYSCDEDFNNSQTTNYPKMDHDRKWNHTRSKIKTESLDELLENDEKYLTQGGFDSELIAVTNVTRREIIENSNEQEKQIIKMLSEGYNQSEIAKKLRVSQGTVSKKISKIREIYKEKSEL